MDDLRQKIRRCEAGWFSLFSTLEDFSPQLCRRRNLRLPQQQDVNAFVPKEGVPLTLAALEAALAAQKREGLRFLRLNSRQALPLDWKEVLGLEEELILSMALLEGDPEQWKRNPAVTVRDSKSCDLREALLDFDRQQAAYLRQLFPPRAGEPDSEEEPAEARSLQDLDVSERTPDFHFLGAFLDGRLAGKCRVFCREGCAELDDLVTAPWARKQYVATTLLAHAAENFPGQLYLHASADDTPKELYARLGFVTVDRCWEYKKLW